MTKSSMEHLGHDCIGWAAHDASGVLCRYQFKRRHVKWLTLITTALGSDDILIKITHCGVCYGDVKTVQNNSNEPTNFPLVPGHEIVGIVQEVGSNVNGFKAGDRAGVGTYVNSCRECEECKGGIEVQCSKGAIRTYNSVDLDGSITQGGYSNFIVVHQSYCFRIAKDYPLELAAPLFCAGITVYTPMIHHKMNQPGKSLGVIGLGGLGHMAVKFGKAFGLNVTVFSTTASKKEEALNLLGADKFVVSTDQQQMKGLAKSLDYIIHTASGDHHFDLYLSTVKTAGTLVIVGVPPEIKVHPISLLLGMRSISGSATGGLKQTQEMLDLCAAHKIYPNVEVVPIDYVNEAFKRIAKRDVKYRFVIDIGNSLK